VSGKMPGSGRRSLPGLRIQALWPGGTDRAAVAEVRPTTGRHGESLEKPSPILLILDLDETLIYATEEPLRRTHDFDIGPYTVYLRPYLTEFLTSCAACFRLAVWSTATDEYVRPVVERIMPTGVEPAFVWGRSRWVRRYDAEQFEEYHVKDLKKVKRLGYRLERVLIADDTPRKVDRHYGNAVYVPPFLGNVEDEILPRLARFLISLRDEPNVRTVEKRGWSSVSP
jgi:TFIIF-interacting CTD phosphatase-like protein